jgi:hypothetical protein
MGKRLSAASCDRPPVSPAKLAARGETQLVLRFVTITPGLPCQLRVTGKPFPGGSRPLVLVQGGRPASLTAATGGKRRNGHGGPPLPTICRVSTPPDGSPGGLFFTLVTRRLAPLRCGRCGEPFAIDALFCFDCGEAYTEAVAVDEPWTAARVRKRYATTAGMAADDVDRVVEVERASQH